MKLCDHIEGNTGYGDMHYARESNWEGKQRQANTVKRFLNVCTHYITTHTGTNVPSLVQGMQWGSFSTSLEVRESV